MERAGPARSPVESGDTRQTPINHGGNPGQDDANHQERAGQTRLDIHRHIALPVPGKRQLKSHTLATQGSRQNQDGRRKGSQTAVRRALCAQTDARDGAERRGKRSIAGPKNLGETVLARVQKGRLRTRQPLSSASKLVVLQAEHARHMVCGALSYIASFQGLPRLRTAWLLARDRWCTGAGAECAPQGMSVPSCEVRRRKFKGEQQFSVTKSFRVYCPTYIAFTQ